MKKLMLLKAKAGYRALQSSLNCPELLLSALPEGGLTDSGGQLHGISVGIIINKL